MTSLTTARNTPQRLGDILSYPVAAAKILYQGGIAVLSGGYAAPASAATGLIAAGRIERTVDNSGGAAGEQVVEVRRGLFKFASSTVAGDIITRADIGADAWLVDDQTVAKTSAPSSSNPTRSIAGKIVDVDPDGGVWVLLGIGL
jgi:hypothetical protein